jgi:hypothetical protein
MPSDFQTVTQDLLGVNEDDNPTSLAENELEVGENVWMFGNALWTRPGIKRDSDLYDARITAVAGSNLVIQGAFLHNRGFGGTRRMLVVCNGNIYTDDTAGNVLDKTTNSVQVTVEGTEDEGPSNRWVMAQHQNVVFGAGGAPADDFWYIDAPDAGGAIERIRLLNSAGSRVTPKLVFTKWNWVFAAHFYDARSTTISTDAAANPMIVRYHDLGTDPSDNTGAENEADNWPAANTFGGTGIGGFGGDFSEYVTGFGDYADTNSDQLVVGTNKRLHFVVQTGNRVAPFRIVDSAENGLVSQNAYIPVGLNGGDAVYVSQDGVHSVRQSIQHGNKANKFLSWKIRKTWASLSKTNIERASGAYWPTEGVVLIAVPDGTINSGNANTHILCLDMKGLDGDELNAETAIWHKWRMAFDTTESPDYQMNPALLFPGRDSNGDPFVYVGTYRGDVGVVNTSIYADMASTDGSSAATLAYDMRWQTKHRDHGAFGLQKQMGRAWAKLMPGGDYGPNARTIFDYGRRSGITSTLTMEPASNAQWGPVGAFKWDLNQWSTSNLEISRVEWSPQGSGETTSFEFSHTGVDQPVGIAQLSYQVGGLGKDTGDG